MKVALVYAPDRCLPTIPYSSLAQLSGVLRAEGHEVMVRDLNVDVFEWLNHVDRLAGYFDFAVNKVQELEDKSSLDPAERNMYRFLAPLVAAPRESILRCPEAAKVMRSKVDFYDPVQFNQAFDDLQTMIRVMYAGNPVFDPENRFFVQQNMEAVSQPLGDPVTDAYATGILDDLLAQEPELIGFTLPFSFQFFEMLKVARLLKEKAPHVKIVVGGPTINDYAYRLFETDGLFKYLDYGVAGEGERAIVELCRAIQGEVPFEEVPNLYWCTEEAGTRTVHKSPLPPDVPDLNSFPAPDFRGIPFEQYLSPEPIANLQTSRGCYYGKCTFCGDGFRRNFRLRAPDLIYEDIKGISESCGVQYFLFWDSLAPPKTLKHVARRIHEAGDDIRWFAETKFEKPYTNPALMDTLAKGGCTFLQFGFESASNRVLDLIDKGNDLERVDVILDLMHERGIWAGVSWFIGFPTATPEEDLQTYSFVNDRDDRVALSVYAGTFMLGRDTLVYANPDRFGITINELETGGVDFTMKDGTPHYDRTEFDHKFRARGDLPLLNHGGYLLYAANHPDRLRAVTGQGRFGRIARDVIDLEQQRPVISDGVRVRDYPYNPFAESDAEMDRGIRLAYYAKTGKHFALTDLESVVLDAVEARPGQVTVSELAEQLADTGGSSVERADVEEVIRELVDRGLLSLPGASYARTTPTPVGA